MLRSFVFIALASLALAQPPIFFEICHDDAARLCAGMAPAQVVGCLYDSVDSLSASCLSAVRSHPRPLPPSEPPNYHPVPIEDPDVVIVVMPISNSNSSEPSEIISLDDPVGVNRTAPISASNSTTMPTDSGYSEGVFDMNDPGAVQESVPSGRMEGESDCFSSIAPTAVPYFAALAVFIASMCCCAAACLHKRRTCENRRRVAAQANSIPVEVVSADGQRLGYAVLVEEVDAAAPLQSV